jgi:hypothetical protein
MPNKIKRIFCKKSALIFGLHRIHLTRIMKEKAGGASMSPLEWILLAIIFVIGIGACIAVNRMRKKGHYVPGSMCAGCPDTMTVDTKPKPDSPSDGTNTSD